MASSADDTKEKKAGEARVVTAHRNQPEFRMFELEELIPVDHDARTVCAAVERLDLEVFYPKSVTRGHGRPPCSARMERFAS